MSFSWEGQGELRKLTDKLKNLKRPIREGLERSGREWVKMIQEGMENTKLRPDGRSEPYNFPAIQTGMLHASFQPQVKGWNTIIVGTTVEYAKYLEQGTNRMLPRPMFQGQFEELRLREIFRRLVEDEIKKHMR